MGASTIGTSGLSFGLVAEAGVGLVQSFTETRNSDKVEARNETGDIVGLSYYNATTAYALSIAVTGAYKNVAGVALGALANATTFASNKVIIDTITINKTNDAFVTVDIAATGYPNLA
jgi:hypothetical protein